ncbi:MAG: hypothetical protein P1U89_23615 [Verrucomicrobiales bacterium]|nr:hypothetical protein [Verrucomicrobiales bacterium]
MRNNLKNIVKWHRAQTIALILTILSLIVLGAVKEYNKSAGYDSSIAQLACVGLVGFSIGLVIVSTILLTVALTGRSTLLATIQTLFPPTGLFLIFSSNSRANRVMKNSGLQPGLFGASLPANYKTKDEFPSSPTPQFKIVERTQEADQSRMIESMASQAASMLSLDLESDDPDAIVNKVYDSVVDLVFARPNPFNNSEAPHALLGSLWGSQIVRKFNWYWADVVVDDRVGEIAIISPNREMIIFPLSFTGACINKQCICTMALAFDMLGKGNFSEIQPNSYENIMLNIHHIVPPYELNALG